MPTRPSISRRSALIALLAAPAAAGCMPSTPDEGSWRLHARRAVGDVVSGVQTARLALEQSLADRVQDKYLQVVAVDAEESAGGAAQKFASEQPPRAEHRRYETVTTRLDEAGSLLAEVRIAVVHGRTEEYPGLVEDLHRTARRLDVLEQDLLHPPRKAGAG